MPDGSRPTIHHRSFAPQLSTIRPRCRLCPSVRAAHHVTHAHMSTSASTSTYFRSKTITAALAFFLGSLGAHRFYLYGPRDVYGWAHVLGTVIGIPGAMLLVASERSSILGWVLAFPGAVSLLAAFSPRSSTVCARTKSGTGNSTRTHAATKPLGVDRDLRGDLFAADRRVSVDDRSRHFLPDLLRRTSPGGEGAVAIAEGPRALHAPSTKKRSSCGLSPVAAWLRGTS